MNSAGDALQAAMFALLDGDTGAGGLRNLSSAAYVGAILDFSGVERDTAMPYVTIGDFASSGWSTMKASGEQIVAAVHIWTEGRKMQPALAVLNRLNQLLGDASLTVAGYQLARSLYESAIPVSEPEDHIQHVIASYRVWLQEN